MMMDFLPRRRDRGGRDIWGKPDRFIPNKAGMDWDWDYHSYVERDSGSGSPKSAYRELLAEVFNMPPTRPYLIFNNRPPTPVQPFPMEFFSKPAKPRRHIPDSPEFTLDLPDMLQDETLNLLDWGSTGVLSIALTSKVYLRQDNGSVSELVTVDLDDDDIAHITSVKWAPDGRRLALAAASSYESFLQLWDSTSDVLTTLNDSQLLDSASAIGSMDWLNNDILTTGGIRGHIANHDVRMRDHVVQTYRNSHQGETCGLKWSPCGYQLASGGTDSVVHIWDRRQSTQWLHRMGDHRDTVKALAWCPFQDSLLASGGGTQDGCIKFWNTQTGACLNSVDTASQVCALLWNKKERELLSSHGLPHNQLTLWKYPSIVKISELTNHTSSVLHMAQSPNGCTVASAGADEKLNLWNVFGTPQAAKPALKVSREPFASFSRSHIR